MRKIHVFILAKVRFQRFYRKSYKKALATTCKVNSGSKKHRAAVADARVSLIGNPEVRLMPSGPLRCLRYFEVQAEWLLSRFPVARLHDVEGVAKLVGRAEPAETGYSVIPGCHMSVALSIHPVVFLKQDNSPPKGRPLK
ncbi:MAG: hypothetical protein ABJG14_07015 [Sulfitobacter sp.]